MNQPIAAVALAAALLVAASRPGSARLRALVAPAVGAADDRVVRPVWALAGAGACGVLTWTVTGHVVAALATVAVVLGAGRAVLRRLEGPRRRDDDPADLAAAWAQLAVCLEIGLPVAAALAAAAEPLTGKAGEELRRVAGLLELGADATQAWAAAQESPPLATFARAAGRSADTGAALARVARAECARLQATLADAAEARAQRASVLIAAPLGLCFLPAFVALGIAPVVVGLAREVLASW